MRSAQSGSAMLLPTSRMPEGIKGGYSMNQFLITAAAEKLSALETVDYLRYRAERANLKDFDRLLALVPDSEPVPGDELPPESKRRTRRHS